MTRSEMSTLAAVISNRHRGEVTYLDIYRYGKDHNNGRGPSVGEAQKIKTIIDELRMGQ